MAPWRVARSLDVLLAQLNTLAPNRSKKSDGSIGDTDHQNRLSDHNPWYGPGIVTARDFTHDPGDLDCHSVAARLVNHRDPRIKYIIWNRRLWTPGNSWRPYGGTNPHTSHLHLSVVASPLCDDTSLWAGFIPQPPEVPEPEEEDMSPLSESELVALDGSPVVWWSCGNIRTWVPDTMALAKIAYRIRTAGGNPAGPGGTGDIRHVDNLDAFGVAIGPMPEGGQYS